MIDDSSDFDCKNTAFFLNYANIFTKKWIKAWLTR